MRTRYIDNIRGFCIFFVVYHHVVIFGMPGYISSVDNFFISFCLPGFFFLSGFLTKEKDSSLYDGANYIWSRLRKYSMRLLVPSLVTLLLFSLVMDLDYLQGVTSELKYGYWFTFSYFVIAIVWTFWGNVKFTLSNCCQERILQLIELGGAFLILLIHQFVTKDSQNIIISTLSFDSATYYFFFFYCGILTNRYSVVLHKLLLNQYVLLMIVVIALLPMDINKVVSLIVKFARVVCLYNLFYFYRNSLTEQMNKWLGCIGRHTLEIYFIHYFLLFGIPHLRLFFNQLSMIQLPIVKGSVAFVELMLIGSITTVTIVTCLLLEKVIGSVPIISKLCFGIQKK